MITYRGLQSWKYQLVDDFTVQTTIAGLEHHCLFIVLASDGMLAIKKGYCWDGPSGPTWDSKTAMQGSLVHDVMYQLIRQGVVPMARRPMVDDMFRNMLLKDGMGRFRAWYFWRAVRAFGGQAAAKKKPLPNEQAP